MSHRLSQQVEWAVGYSFLRGDRDEFDLVAQVLRLLAAGRRNQELARELVVTLETVKKHTSHILYELCAANRTKRWPMPARSASCPAAGPAER